jgi:hypothetical protein
MVSSKIRVFLAMLHFECNSYDGQLKDRELKEVGTVKTRLIFLRDANFIGFSTTCFGLCRPSSGQ